MSAGYADLLRLMHKNPQTFDPWLQRWLPLVAERSAGAPVLELGCGKGEDTAALSAAGLEVIAVDLSESSLAAARLRAPAARFLCQDIRAPFPVGPERIGVIVASLSLHYFSWTDTVLLIERIHSTLRPAGILLCRLNSTKDHHFGASGHPAIEENYYNVKGRPKRFFDEAAVRRLFASGWNTLSCEEAPSQRYGKPKVAWEVILERSD